MVQQKKVSGCNRRVQSLLGCRRVQTKNECRCITEPSLITTEQECRNSQNRKQYYNIKSVPNWPQIRLNSSPRIPLVRWVFQHRLLAHTLHCVRGAHTILRDAQTKLKHNLQDAGVILSSVVEKYNLHLRHVSHLMTTISPLLCVHKIYNTKCAASEIIWINLIN